ncbi:MAG: class I SAM-dependent methyltransferase [Gallionella sp.]
MVQASFVVRKGDRFLVDKRQRPFSLLIDAIILRELLEFLERSFVRGSDVSILDAGAGTRPYYSVYRDYFPSTYSFDRSDSPHDIASVDVIASADRLPFRDDQFDCVLCTEVLEHVPDPVRVLEEFNRVLKPGGKVVLTTPWFNPIHEAPHDYYRYSPFAFDYLARRLGFRVESIVEKGGFVAFAILFFQYPWALIWQKLSTLGFFKWVSPVALSLFIVPQQLYLEVWKRWGRRQLVDTNGMLQSKMSLVTLGYITVLSKESACNCSDPLPNLSPHPNLLPEGEGILRNESEQLCRFSPKDGV